MKKILLTFLTISILLSSSPIVLADNFIKPVEIPNASTISYTKEGAVELQDKFNKSILYDDLIRSYMIQMSKDLNVRLFAFELKTFKQGQAVKHLIEVTDQQKTILKDYINKHKLQDGYYYLAVSKDNKATLIRLSIDVAVLITEQIVPGKFLSATIGEFLKKLFGVTKVQQYKKFTDTYDKIVNRMNDIVMQEIMYEVKQHPEKYIINNTEDSIIIENCTIDVVTGKNIVIKNCVIKNVDEKNTEE